MTPDDRILTDAERLVEEILNDVREALLDRATKYAHGPTLTKEDIAKAGRSLFWWGHWPHDLFDWML